MKIYCKTLLQGEHWRSDAVLSITQDGVIAAIGQGSPQSADIVLQGLVVPGMPNAHSHSFQRLIAGLTGPHGHQRDSFWSWREAMYRTANRISPEQFGAVAQWVFVEMLKAGFTSCAEFHYLHHQPGGEAYANPAEMSMRVIEAASVSGIGLTLLPVLYCSAGFGQDRVSEEQKRFASKPEQYLRLLELCRDVIENRSLVELGMAPHSLRAVPAAILHEVLRSWPDRRCPVHIHVAEQVKEVEDALAWNGRRPVEQLFDIAPVDRRWCLIHATHLSDDEVARIARSGATVGLCPMTEANLGDGIFRATDYLAEGGSFGIGSDSNITTFAAQELQQLEYSQRLRDRQRNVLASDAFPNVAANLWTRAMQGGARAAGRPEQGLAPGGMASFVELVSPEPEALAAVAPEAALDFHVFAGRGFHVGDVVVRGRRTVQAGHHPLEDRIHADYAAAMARISERLAARDADGRMGG